MAKKKKAYKNGCLSWFKTPKGISIIIFIFVFVLFVLYAKSYNAKQTPTGDEPHYIIAAQSLIKDHDIDLANNYKNRDYWDYFPGEIDPHIALESVHGETNPMHGVGISILLIPFYLIKERLGTIIFANLIGALLAVNIFLLLWERTKNKILSASLALIGIFSIPLSIYSFQIFPELLGALIIIYAFRRLPDSFWPILPLAFLPWIHYKYSPIVLIFIVILIMKKRYYYLIPLILSLVGLLFFNKYFYGSFKPYVPFGSGVLTPGFLGIFIDRENGLLAWSPFFIFFFFAV
ncbi:MAG: hypothetical protein NT039_04350, partial [Candidatus Berkelbacteria bacterium]|nr:hypothetical protein [Candidatus Berkelbacteria bacterium]